MPKGIFFLVAGPAGVGKTTLLKRLVAEESDLLKAVSVTTRLPREGEVDGREYFFWNELKFQEAIQRGEFLEFAIVHGKAFYGTLAKFVLEKLDQGYDVVKDIDVQGVEQIVKLPAFKGRVATIFVMPPSQDELFARLRGRKSESDQTFESRVQSAKNEMAKAKDYDYVLVNDDLDRAVNELKMIRKAAHDKMK